MSGWGIKDDKTSSGTVTLTAPTITFNEIGRASCRERVYVLV